MPKKNSDIRPIIQEGLEYFRREEWEKAISAFSKGLEIDPDHPVPYFYSSLAHLAANRDAEAESLLKKGRGKAPENVLGQNIRAILSFRKGKLDEALEMLGRAGVMEHPAVQAFILLEIEKALAEAGS